MTLYTIQATIIDSNGTRVASSDARTLGDAYGRWYTDRGVALDAIEDLELDPLPGEPSYHVAQHHVAIRDWTTEPSEFGAFWVSATVVIDGWNHYSTWHAQRSAEGCLEACGPDLDAWIDPALGKEFGGECAVAIGNEVFSLAS
jgi:hypothetical protein